jgi:hypothetical protein
MTEQTEPNPRQRMADALGTAIEVLRTVEATAWDAFMGDLIGASDWRAANVALSLASGALVHAKSALGPDAIVIDDDDRAVAQDGRA